MSKIKVLKLKDRLKREIQLIQTLDLLRQIAASEFHNLEKERDKASEFILLLGTFFNFFEAKQIHDEDYDPHRKPITCVVAITSNEGFLGALNNEVLTQAMSIYQESPDSRFVIVGSRGVRRIREAGIEADEFPGIPFPLRYSAVQPLQEYLMSRFAKKEISMVKIVYPRCHSFSQQRVEVSDILPFNISSLRQNSAKKFPLLYDPEYVVVEPDAKRIIEYTVALCFQRQLFEIFWNSKLSEVAARTMELNARYDRLSKNAEHLKSKYFRACHEVIDEGIREVFAGISFSKKLRNM